MRFSTPLKLSSILLLIQPTTQCLIYSATMPFSTTLPFTASLTDNNRTTCWLSQTYVSHARQQKMYEITHLKPSQGKWKRPSEKKLYGQEQVRGDEEKTRLRKRSTGAKISLTARPSLLTQSLTDPSIHPPKNTGGGIIPQSKETQDVYHLNDIEEEEGKEWINWDFNCLEGYEAHVGVGLRNVYYRRGMVDGMGGRNWTFTAEAAEDLWREEWKYEVKLWC